MPTNGGGMVRWLLVVVLALGSSACDLYDNDNTPRNPIASGPINPTTTTTIVPVMTRDRIEFRVIGASLTAGPVIIRHTDPTNGVTLYTGGVPYFAAVFSAEPATFLFLEASAFGMSINSFLQVQIYVNGALFREAFAQGLTLT